MTFGQVDPARLQGEALRRWYCGRPMKSRPSERRRQRRPTMPSLRNRAARPPPPSAIRREARLTLLPISGLSGTRRSSAAITNIMLEATSRFRPVRIIGAHTFKLQRRRQASGTTGRREAARIAMDIRPARSRRSVVNHHFHPATVRALVERVVPAVLSPIGETRRNATCNISLTARSAGD